MCSLGSVSSVETEGSLLFVRTARFMGVIASELRFVVGRVDSVFLGRQDAFDGFAIFHLD